MKENNIEKINTFLNMNSSESQKKFLLSNYFEDVKNKNKMNMLPNQIQKYILAINKNIDALNKEDFLDGFYNKFFYEYFSPKNHHYIHSNSKYNIEKLPNIENKQLKAKSKNKYYINNIINKKYKTNYAINNNKNNFLNKTFNINKTKYKNIDNDINLLFKEKKNKYNISRQSFIHPFNVISNTEDKNFYIKNQDLNNSIYNITEEGKVIEKKLFNKEKKKYFPRFKTRYKGLMKKSKKYMIDMNEYINGKGGTKNNIKKNLLNKYKIIKVQTVLNQIKRKIKNINHKEKISDIINDVKQFQRKEKDVREKFEKTDEKFNNLITDSNLIRKRILKKFNH